MEKHISNTIEATTLQALNDITCSDSPYNHHILNTGNPLQFFPANCAILFEYAAPWQNMAGIQENPQVGRHAFPATGFALLKPTIHIHDYH